VPHVSLLRRGIGRPRSLSLPRQQHQRKRVLPFVIPSINRKALSRAEECVELR
jgi:hypothetical protein